MMKTEKRKANEGERILITDARNTDGQYKNGDIATVRGKRAVFENIRYVNEWERTVADSEYEVIVEQPKPTKNERITALETEVSALKAKVEALEKAVKYPLTARFDAETTAKADAILSDIKRKATPQQKTQSPNEQRADVIKRAKAFVSDKYIRDGIVLHKVSGPNTVEFVVNSEKKTVVALLRRAHIFTEELRHKGIAKCDPSDVFNADIGKAIALGRALGVDVTEFTKAVQPTEVVVGQRIYYTDTHPNLSVVNGKSRTGFREIRIGLAISTKGNRILDDTDAVYE